MTQATAPAATLDGTFGITMTTTMGAQQAALELAIDGSALRGKLNSVMGTIEFEGGTVSGNELTWTVITGNPMVPTIDFKAVIDGDNISGQAIMGPMGEAPFEGARAAEGETPGLGDVVDVRLLGLGMSYAGPVGTLLLTGVSTLSPAQLVDLLLDPERHSSLVGQEVTVQRVPGSRVQLGPAEGEGYLAEFIGGSHVAFMLRAPGYPENLFSTVTIMAKATPDGNSNVTVYQQNVPKELLPDVRAAWERDYLSALRKARN